MALEAGVGLAKLGASGGEMVAAAALAKSRGTSTGILGREGGQARGGGLLSAAEGQGGPKLFKAMEGLKKLEQSKEVTKTHPSLPLYPSPPPPNTLIPNTPPNPHMNTTP